MTWLTTVTKLAPYVLKLGEIGISALPHFTRRKADIAPVPFEYKVEKVESQQIAELQAAATQNAAHIRELATDLTRAIAAIEARFRRLEMLAYTALALSAVSVMLVAIVWAARR